MSRRQGIALLTALLVALVAGGGVWLVTSLDHIAAAAIRSYGSDVLGVRVKLDRARIAVGDGSGALHELTVGNPRGFYSPYALRVSEASIVLDPATLPRDVVLIRSITVLRPEIVYEVGVGGSNLDAIQHHVDRHLAQPPGGRRGSREGGKRLIIERLVIRGAVAQVSAAGVQAGTVVVQDIVLRNIGGERGGATPGEVARTVGAAIARNVSRSVGPQALPGPVRELLR